MSKTKGRAGEQEAVKWLRETLEPVYAAMGQSPETISRNLNQSRNGGTDLVGIDWCAIEVKREEANKMKSWWAQTLRQTKPGQVPLLMWRTNRQPWRFRTRLTYLVGPVRFDLVVDLEEAAAKDWLAAQVQTRALAAQRGQLREWGLDAHLPGAMS